MKAICQWLIALSWLASSAFANSHTNEAFLSLSDIHFDPFVGCHDSPCAWVEKLKVAPIEEWRKIFEQAYQNKLVNFKKDTDYPLLRTTLNALRNVGLERKPAFVIVSGDFLAHDFRLKYLLYSGDRSMIHYEEFIKKTLVFLSGEIRHAVPDVSVYPVIGNNDTYGNDYQTDPYGAFLSDANDIWGRLMQTNAERNQFEQSFKKIGNYAIDRGDSLRLVFLNSVPFSINAKEEDEGKAAAETLAWFSTELSEAKRLGRRVLVVAHIPPGVDVYATLKSSGHRVVPFWKPEYTKTFLDIIEKHPGIIEALLVGHSHMDYFQRVLLASSDKLLISSTPAVSPLFGNNPAFKGYDINEKTAVLSDYTTYYLPRGAGESWSVEYRFNEVYQPACKACKLESGMAKLGRTGPLAEKHIEFYNVSRLEAVSIADDWDPYYWCRIGTIQEHAYQLCTGTGSSAK